MARAGLQIAVFLAVLTALAVPLGAYLQRVFGGGRRVALEGPLGPVERGVYRLLRVDAANDQPWREYAMSMVVFSAVCLLSAQALLRVQSVHPLNPHDFHVMPWDVSFNTAVSFVTYSPPGTWRAVAWLLRHASSSTTRAPVRDDE